MPIFPTQYSTLKSDAVNLHLQQQYGLKETTCRLLIRNVSDTYLVEGVDEKYIFKIYRDAHRSLDEIKGELELINTLKNAGIGVAYPITDLNGKQVQQFDAAEGVRNGVLFSFAKGSVAIDLDQDQLSTIGREVAKMHQVTSSIEIQHHRPVFDFDTTLIRPLKTLEPHFENMPEEFTWLSETAQLIIDKLSELGADNFSYGYIHYDLLPKNFHFDELNNLTLFDFDFAGKGHLVNDLMTLRVHYFFHKQFNRISPEQADQDFKTLIEAYREIRPLSEQELAAIPYLGFMFWVFFLEFYYLHFEDWSNTFLTPNFVKQRVQLIKKWMADF